MLKKPFYIAVAYDPETASKWASGEIVVDETDPRLGYLSCDQIVDLRPSQKHKALTRVFTSDGGSAYSLLSMDRLVALMEANGYSFCTPSQVRAFAQMSAEEIKRSVKAKPRTRLRGLNSDF